MVHLMLWKRFGPEGGMIGCQPCQVAKVIVSFLFGQMLFDNVRTCTRIK